MIKFFDAFISYGRADSKDFAEKLYQQLTERGLKVWFDKRDIPHSVDYQLQIDDGIEKAHNFLFIITPHSVKSSYCRKEIELAVQCHKRIIPLLHVKADELKEQTHPIIRKIQRLEFQEGIDDFEKSFANLIKVIQRHEDYVQQHTQLLAKALEWERNQKQTSCLLIGEEKQQAQSWLKIRFKDEQPPCIPTDLHCEYITESIKNTNNLMTQVFISYADADRATMEKICNSLRRASITVWTNRTDIRTGEVFEEAICRGVEQADNVVYLLSPESVTSEFARQELEYALSLNKRIIPVLVRATPPEQIPEMLRGLHYIDLADNVQEADYHLDESQLLRILHQDEAYYNEHKVLLTKALKWKWQHENPSILLRGYNLRSAETWLKVATKRMLHPPTALMEELIAESLRQPPVESLDVFISYSRADADFARKLNDELQLQGKMTWLDQESIASGADFQQEIKQGIQACDNFLFILSPRSVESQYCEDEVDYAAKMNKRFVTVLHREVNPDNLHPELAKVQWIDFRQNSGDFQASFRQLVRTLETDREHLHNHTKWSQRAIAWHEKDKSADLLLRGSEFAIAEQWLREAESNQKQPPPTELQKAFIQSSRNAIRDEIKTEERRVLILRLLLALVSTALVGAVVGVVLAIQQKTLAEDALKEQATTLARESLSLTDSGTDREFDALIQAIRANQPLRQRNLEPEAADRGQMIQALREALYRVKEYNRLEGHTKDIEAISASPDGKMIATASTDGTARLWSQTGRFLKTLQHDDDVLKVSFSPDGQTIATYSRDQTVKLWNHQGESFNTLKHDDEILEYSFSPDGQIIATYSQDRTVKLWDRQGKPLKTLPFTSDVIGASFSPNSQWLVTLTQNGQIQLWTSQGKSIRTIKQAGVRVATFSPDSQTIATVTQQEIILRRLTGNKTGSTRIERVEDITGFTFSPDGQKLALTFEKGILLWSRQQQKPQTLPQSRVNSIQFSPNSQTFLSASNDRTVTLWRLNGEKLQTFRHDDPVYKAIFIPHASLIMTLSGKSVVKIWNLENPYSKFLVGHTKQVYGAVFSPNGQTIATRSGDGTARLWHRKGQLTKILKGPNLPLPAIGFHPGSTSVATVNRDEEFILWTLDGKPIFRRKLPYQVKLSSLSFSQNGQRIAIAMQSGDYSTVQIWSLAGITIKTLPGDQRSPTFNPKYPILTTATHNKVYLWTQDGQALRKLDKHHAILHKVSFSPDGTMIATASADGTAKLWTLQGREIVTLKHNDRVQDVQFSHDGQTVATASDDRTAKLWNLKGQELQTLSDHRDRVFQVSFSPDRQTIATASNDNMIRFWNFKGQLLKAINQNHEIYRMNFSPDGQHLLVAREQNSAVLWSLPPDSLQADPQQVLENLLGKACSWIDHYLKNKPEEDSDRTLCEGIGKK
ncbi:MULTISPECIES: toll/interleukin-1 receptor domain-containing protein [Trichocoleus]|uniref:TIR domain-containing protein n=1 Tax=Trichocoleus desertorum GB2-A4 TaxID=2933944 RepID=A0ABV0JGR8_9CYAN|nr:TIR domain-containing protein [Trichocoleus sp. FACHB-46]MBD1860074.1 TIR domain-containing protein [Trichocoleus sp. FACHB-46]